MQQSKGLDHLFFLLVVVWKFSTQEAAWKGVPSSQRLFMLLGYLYAAV